MGNVSASKEVSDPPRLKADLSVNPLSMPLEEIWHVTA